MTEEDKAAYRLSRIFAEGWNSAKAASRDGDRKSNPYAGGPERARWNEGYAKASG